MDYYFFLKDPETEPEITVSNFLHTHVNEFCDRKRFICLAFPQINRWTIRTVKALEPFESYTLRASELGMPADDIAKVLVFLSPQEFDGDFDELPRVEEFPKPRFSFWRANLRIRSKTSSVSYQGDFPSQMLDMERGTMVSISPFFQKAHGIHNKVFVVTFRRQPASVRGHLLFRRLKNNRAIKEVDIYTNRVNSIDLSDLKLDGADELILLMSPDTACVPIYFSHSADYRFLSLEHTHPPIELTVFGSREKRFGAVKTMKKFWLGAKP